MIKFLRYSTDPSYNSCKDDFTLIRTDSEINSSKIDDSKSSSTIFWTGNDLGIVLAKHAQTFFQTDASVSDILAILIVNECWDLIPEQSFLISSLRDCLNLHVSGVRVSITPVFNEEDAKVLMEVKDVAQMQTFRRKFNAKFLHYTSEYDKKFATALENGIYPFRQSNNVMVIGSGGREHAITDALLRSPYVSKVFVCPGNYGTSTLSKVETETGQSRCENVNIAVHDANGLLSFAVAHNVALVVVGPEQPLVDGLSDMMRSKDILCFGPSQAASVLESSKAWSKAFMQRHGLPTAVFRSFSGFSEAKEYLEAVPHSVVVKASGLAAGKGVVLPTTTTEAVATAKSLLDDKSLGDAGTEIVVEQRLVGEEVSILAFCDGLIAVGMPPAQDHKRIFDDDKGPNTGGMGAYAPTPLITPMQYRQCMDIVQRSVDAMRSEGLPYEGVLYAGFMLTQDGPFLLEFNCRFGDPETQVLLPLLSPESDLFLICLACCHHTLTPSLIRWQASRVACTVVAAADGYPGKYSTGLAISMEPFQVAQSEEDALFVYHAGAAIGSDGAAVTSGGRVLAVTAVGASLSAAVDTAYRGIEKISFPGMHYRKDIAKRGLSRPIRLGVLGSTRGTDLTAIIDAINSHTLNAQVCLVISNRSQSGILAKAQANGIAHKHVSATGLTREQYDQILSDHFLDEGVDLVLLIGYMRLLSANFVQVWRERCLNVHPSLLPEFAGGMDMDVHAEVIKAGKTRSGCTIHFVTEEVDGGPILVQLQCEVRQDDTADSLKSRVQELEGQAFLQAVEIMRQRIVLGKEYGQPIQTQQLTYKSAGVDIDAGEMLVEMIKPLCKKTRRLGCDAELGGFGGLFDLAQAGLGYPVEDIVLVSGTDGVGTKLKIAQESCSHASIGIDLVAMCVNDILVCGAEPLFFLDYYATGKLDVQTAAAVVSGIAAGCQQAGAALIGGETAEMAGFYRPGEYDVAGFAVGAVSRKHILPRNIQEGDVLLALPSSGVHSNGFSLVRKCVERSGLQWSDQCPFVSESCSLSEVLLSPTKIYVKQLLPLIKSGLLKGMAHITGGGLLDNIPRMLPENLAARLDFPQLLATGWTLPPVFRWLQEIAKLPQDELLRTFNCGVGMVLAVEKSLAASILAELVQRVQDEELEAGDSSGRVIKSGLPMVLGQIVSKPPDNSSQVIVIGSVV